MTKTTFCFQKGNIQYSQGAGSRFLFLLFIKAIVEWDFQGALCSVMPHDTGSRCHTGNSWTVATETSGYCLPGMNWYELFSGYFTLWTFPLVTRAFSEQSHHLLIYLISTCFDSQLCVKHSVRHWVTSDIMAQVAPSPNELKIEWGRHH